MKILYKAAELLVRAAVTAVITIQFAGAVITAACEERGYEAVGGEWLAIIFIAWALWWFSGIVVKYIEKGQHND